MKWQAHIASIIVLALLIYSGSYLASASFATLYFLGAFLEDKIVKMKTWKQWLTATPLLLGLSTAFPFSWIKTTVLFN